MITVMKSTEGVLHKLEQPVDGSWINLVNPTAEETSRLCLEYNIPEDFIHYPMDIDESPRTEIDDGATLIGLRVPVDEGASAGIPYTTMPLGIVMTDRVIITVCNTNPHIIMELMSGGRARSLSTPKRNRFVLHLLLAVANKYLHYLRELNRKVDVLEDRLQRSLRNREVLELLKYQKSLTLFMTALKSNELVMGRLQKTQLFFKYEEDRDLLEDALTEFGQAIEMTTISSNILAQMMDAFASIISNNLNVVMKFMASVTIIVSLPALLAAMYGMNIKLPFAELDSAFIIIVGIMVVLTLGVVVIFLRKDWM